MEKGKHFGDTAVSLLNTAARVVSLCITWHAGFSFTIPAQPEELGEEIRVSLCFAFTVRS